MKKWDLNNASKTIQFSAALLTAFIGGSLFSLIRFPIPWLLGPMAALLIASRFKNVKLIWPVSMRNTGLIIVGYSIGISFTTSSLSDMISHLPSMLILTALIVLVCAGSAFVMSKYSGIDYPTSLTSSIPGGLSQIVVFAEEMKSIDITTVTFFHVTRVIMVVFLVPLLIISPLFAANRTNDSSKIMDNVIPEWSDLFPLIFLFALICFLAARIGRIFKLPAPYFLGPVIVTAAIGLLGLQGPPLPLSLLDISQFMVGGYIGLLLKPEQLDNKRKTLLLALMNGLILICATMFFSFLLTKYYDLSAITGFLSLAPGGMDQMGIIAQEVNADVSTVTSYQLFRMAFIYAAVPPLLKLVLKLSLRKKDKNSNVKLNVK
ncbi:AbrB family transcriptional regulator [Peribacillus frigoritolerans]|uniref:AbrB family transcriptional regulator n=1 Tax=Peribacillus frigoritolerans TaxID=450367 RepID=UPI0006AC72E6|nr:AbrB family transcriptional regulator [Peribacillus frigoritolerans]KOR81626.1 AbrB family transcriptional regulator [Bacillus sp. FJAT-21352]KOR83355.1 AbrB family transcriptional regulator [Bacillus sp. FJAT-22058]AZV60179.1 AbrB family transcriptional regulator [Peribacillus frigoritolerans]USK82269.1 AbrB family transcriptional regulator [Peribacillus frigoritolerans]UZD48863.1 AbrB family transcriptional regulator [Peribacillus frigoritolerans]